MNYFAHARVAASLSDDDALVLGAMLPDFAHMIGVRLAGLSHAGLADGATLHHRTDAAFHASPSFGALLREGVRELETSGLRRGPARAAAHVGVELLLDAALVETDDGNARYLAALRAAPDLAAAIGWREDRGPPRWQTLHARLLAAGPPARHPAPERIAERIARVLEPRPRLRLAASELTCVSRWLTASAPTVARHAPDLLAETFAGLRG